MVHPRPANRAYSALAGTLRVAYGCATSLFCRVVEREIAGERIRDKIAASKRKGMWIGRVPPLGYDVENRRPVIYEAEAKTVRHIQQYLSCRRKKGRLVSYTPIAGTTLPSGAAYCSRS